MISHQESLFIIFWIQDGISYAIKLAKGDVRENENTCTIYGAMLGVSVTGLVAIPVTADAKSNTDSERNKKTETGDPNYENTYRC